MSATDNSKSLSPAWAIATGVILLAVAVGLLVLVIYSLKTGEIWRWSKYHPGVVSRAESPASFWYSAFFSTVISLMLAGASVLILRQAVRDLRK
jgi:hypothetical protein